MSERVDPHTRAQVSVLLDRIEALEALLAHYRVGSRPSERLLQRLDKAAAATATVRNEYGQS